MSGLISAKWGCGATWVVVTERVRQLMQPGLTAFATPADLKCDPCLGYHKELQLVFSDGSSTVLKEGDPIRSHHGPAVPPANTEPNWLDPAWQVIPESKAILDLLRRLTPNFAPLRDELTDSEWTAFRALAQKGAAEGILRLSFTSRDGPPTVECYRVRGDYVGAMPRGRTIRNDRPIDLRLMAARLTGTGESWASYLRAESTSPEKSRGVVLSLVWDGATVPGYVEMTEPPAIPPAQTKDQTEVTATAGKVIQERRTGMANNDFRINKSKPVDPPEKASRVQPPAPTMQRAERAVTPSPEIPKELTSRQERFLLACYAAFEKGGSFVNPVRVGMEIGFSEPEARDLWHLLAAHQPQLLTINSVGAIKNCGGLVTTEGRELAREIEHDVNPSPSSQVKSEGRPPAADEIAGVNVKWLYQIIKEGRRTPVGKLAYGLLLLGVAAALIALFFRFNFKYAFFSMIGIIPLAGAVLTLSWASEHGKKDVRPVYLAFLILCLLAFAAVVTLSISVTFFGVPEAGAKRIFGQ
jgi:hypothetical protein